MRIGVVGASGRMGQLVIAGIQQAPDLQLAWAVGRDWSPDLVADVLIDFSTPEGFQRLMAEARIPVVSGTTGVTVPEVPRMPLIHAANFSLGVAVLARLVAEAGRLLPDFDAEITEIHHRGKKDAPSGTALRLAAALDPTRPLAHGRTGPRQPREIGMHALRAGDVIGDHTVMLAGGGERLELRHAATHRGVFAAGAIASARWLQNKAIARYTIEDVLGF